MKSFNLVIILSLQIICSITWAKVPATVGDIVVGDRFVTTRRIDFSNGAYEPNDRNGRPIREGKIASSGECIYMDYGKPVGTQLYCNQLIGLQRNTSYGSAAGSLEAGTILTVDYVRGVWSESLIENRYESVDQLIIVVSPNGNKFFLSYQTLNGKYQVPQPMLISEMKNMLSGWFTYLPLQRPNL